MAGAGNVITSRLNIFAPERPLVVWGKFRAAPWILLHPEICCAAGDSSGNAAQHNQGPDRLLRNRGAAVPAADPPPAMPKTTVWSYGSLNHTGTFNYPAFTIEANTTRPVRVKWINDLIDASGNFLRTCCRWTRRCTGPTRRAAYRWARTCIQLSRAHRAHIRVRFRSSPIFTAATPPKRATAMPKPGICPRQTNSGGLRERGFVLRFFQGEFFKHGVTWEPGTAVFQYANDQRARHSGFTIILWA